MKGTNHLITGAASLAILDAGIKIISDMTDIEIYDKLHGSAIFKSAFNFESSAGNVAGIILTILIAIVLFAFGLLLPDIDQENSLLGRIIYLPIRHRTWTHTIWIVILLSLCMFASPVFFWLAFGYALHIFFDSLSKGGICWFYPISRYRAWASGAQVKKNHFIYFYRTGEASETIVMVIVAFLGIIALVMDILINVGAVTL